MNKKIIFAAILASLFGVLMFWQVSMVTAVVSPQGGGESPIILSPITFGKAVALKNLSYGDPIQQISIMRGQPILASSFSFTVEFWVKFNQLQNYNNQTLFRDGSRLNLFTETGPSGTGNKLAIITSDGTTQKAFVGPELPVGTWNHIAVTYFYVSPIVSTPVNLALHVNGKTYSAPEMMPFSDDLSMLEIGKLYDGEIDELRISNIRRYDPQTPDYPVPKQGFPTDEKTLVLLHLDDSVVNSAVDGPNVSTQIQGGAQYINSTVPFSAKSKLNWITNQLSLEADEFYMDINGKRYFANAGVNLHFDPGTNYTSLEAIWYENGVEMRLFMYFFVKEGKWGTGTYANEIRTYNGRNPGDWIYYHDDGLAAGIPLGTPYIKDYLDITSYVSPNDWGLIHFKNLKLQAFLDRPAPVPPNIISIRPAWIKEEYKAQPWVNQGDKVAIKGSNFSRIASENQVYVGGARMPTQFNTVSFDRTTLTFVLTTELDFEIGNYYDVSVTTPDGRSNSSKIRIISPTVLFSAIPNPSRIGDIITLRGINFGQKQGTVFLYGQYSQTSSGARLLGGGAGIHPAEIKSWKNNEIKIMLPKALRYQGNKEYNVKVNGSYGGRFIYSSNTIKLRVK